MIFKLILQLQVVNLAIPNIFTPIPEYLGLTNGRNFNSTSIYNSLLDLFGYLEVSWVILGCCVMFTLLQRNWRRSVCWSSWCLAQQIHYLQLRVISSDTFSLVSWYSTMCKCSNIVQKTSQTLKWQWNTGTHLVHTWNGVCSFRGFFKKLLQAHQSSVNWNNSQ